MMRTVLILALLALGGCGGTAWNTTVADSLAVRAQMVASVEPGRTSETALVTRWGQPVQKVRDGGQVEYIYRDMRGPDGRHDWRGDSEHYVIVTFQYGIATAVRSSETEICRATFAPRPPGYGFSNPSTVAPVATCPGLYRPPVGSPVLPGTDPDARGESPSGEGDPGGDWPSADPIYEDQYVGDPAKGK